MTDFQGAFLGCLAASGLAAYPIFRGLLAIRSRQTVSEHVAEHAHKQGTPTMGGLIAVVGLLPWLVTSVGQSATWTAVLALLVGYAVIGFVDDFVIPRLMKGKRGLGWTQKLLMEFGFAAVALAIGGVTTPGAFVAGVFFILFFANAFNFSDGLDWLSSTILVAFCIGLAGVGYLTGATGTVTLAAALVGAILPFMVLNRPPAKIFMGDVGSMPIGGLLGLSVAALVNPAVSPGLGGRHPMGWLGGLAILFLSVMMIAELVPVPIQIGSVKLRGKKVFLATPIHHAFQRMGWKETRVVALFAGIQLLGSILAIAIVWGAGSQW